MPYANQLASIPSPKFMSCKMYARTSGMIALPSLPLTYLKGISTLSAADTWMLGRST
jgi:hypothetical protein